jgi:hypothetical protein
VTALQDWLNIRPMDARSVKAFICDSLRGLNAVTADEAVTVQDPTLIRPGIERC